MSSPSESPASPPVIESKPKRTIPKGKKSVPKVDCSNTIITPPIDPIMEDLTTLTAALSVADNSTSLSNAKHLSIEQFWKAIQVGSKDRWKQVNEFMLHQFGTALSCNRFAVGEVIEDATNDFLKVCGIDALCVPSAKRIDIVIKNVKELEGLSSKYVSTGNHVILHNSQRKTNTDLEMSPTLLFLPTEWWFLHPKTITELGLNVADYMKNTGDSLQLSFKLLEALRLKEYPYTLKCELQYDKSKCLKKATSDLTYQIINDLLNPDTPEIIRNYLQTLLDSIPSRNE